MLAVLQAAPAADIFTLPLVLTVAPATVALVAVAVHVRRALHAGVLGGVTLAASAVTASAVVASALLLTVVLGNATSASAEAAEREAAEQVDSSSFSTPSNQLTGPQLPTE